MSGERSRSSSSSSSSSADDEEQKGNVEGGEEGGKEKIDWGKDNAIVWNDGRKKEPKDELPKNTDKPSVGFDLGGQDVGEWCMKPVSKVRLSSSPFEFASFFFLSHMSTIPAPTPTFCIRMS